MTSHQQLQEVFAKIPQSIIALFSTHLTEYQIGEDTQIDISTQLDEDSLNKIIKDLLQSVLQAESLDKVNFDFLVGGKLLKGKLKSHLVRYEISCEQVVEIQYFISFSQFQQMKQSPLDDWVSSICEVLGEQHNIGIVSALFDGSIAFHDKPLKKDPKIKNKIHEAPIKSVKCIPSETEHLYYVISGGIDEQIRVSKFSTEKNFQLISVNDHSGSLLCIDYNPNLDGNICSAGSAGNLNIWKLPENFLQEETMNEVKTEKKKKRKTILKSLPLLTYRNFHNDSINSVCWLSGSNIATGSSDHSIKIIDVVKMKELKLLLTKDSITTGIDYANNTLFTSHEDGYIRTWDFRSQAGNPSETFKSHSKFSSCVKSQSHSHIFATSSYDQTVKIWDTRSVFPLQTLMTNYDKVFTIAWKSEKQLVSGGSNPFLTFHQI